MHLHTPSPYRLRVTPIVNTLHYQFLVCKIVFTFILKTYLHYWTWPISYLNNSNLKHPGLIISTLYVFFPMMHFVDTHEATANEHWILNVDPH